MQSASLDVVLYNGNNAAILSCIVGNIVAWAIFLPVYIQQAMEDIIMSDLYQVEL